MINVGMWNQVILTLGTVPSRYSRSETSLFYYTALTDWSF